MKKNLLLILTQLIFITIYAQTPFRAGINFPFRTPETTTLNDFLNRLSETNTPSMRQMTFADVYWKQVEPTNDNWDFSDSDSAYLNPYAIIPVAELFSIMASEDTVGIQVPWKACTNPSECYWDPANDSIDTKDYLSTVINRYKNQTNYWEIANEFNNASPPTGLPLPEKKIFLEYCYNWIKQYDAAATVIFPGMVGTYGFPFENNYSWLRNFLDIGGANTFDVMNYHDYNSWWTLPAHYDSIRTILDNYGYNNKEIWITETSISSENISPITPDYSSEDEQAADVWRRFSLLWAKGARVVFWHSFWSSGVSTDWGEFGLLNSNGIKKKSFHSFKLLMDKVTGFTQISLNETGTVSNDNTTGGDGVWVVQYTVDDESKWVIWSPNNQSYTLTNIATPTIKVTHVVPTSLEQNGNSANFETGNFNTTDGEFNFDNLSSLPVLVEEQDNTGFNSKPEMQNIVIFPNPAKEEININSRGKQIKKIMISDITGKRIIEKTNIEQKETINITGFKSGVYIITIQTSAKTYTKQIIKK